MLKNLLNLSFLTNSEAVALAQVAETAMRVGDKDILAWVDRAMSDGRALGRLRERDRNTLNRLEVTYAREFYRGSMQPA